MGSKVHHHSFVAAAENPRVREGRDARADFDGDAAGVVEDAMGSTPAIGVPNPVGKRAVDERGPEKGKDHTGDDASSLGDGTDREGRGDGAEHHLVKREEERWDQRRGDRGGGPNLLQAKVV